MLLCTGLGAGSVRARFFFDLSPFVLRLFFVLKTKNNRRTNEEQTVIKRLRHEASEKGRQRIMGGEESLYETIFFAMSEILCIFVPVQQNVVININHCNYVR